MEANPSLRLSATTLGMVALARKVVRGGALHKATLLRWRVALGKKEEEKEEKEEETKEEGVVRLLVGRTNDDVFGETLRYF